MASRKPVSSRVTERADARNLDLSSIRSYDNLVAEAKRVYKLTRWVHIGALAMMARDLYGVTAEQFAKDVDQKLVGNTIHAWIEAYEVWRKVPVAAKREAEKRGAKYTDYRRAALIRKKTHATPKKALAEALDRGAEFRMSSYISALKGLVAYFETGHKLTPTQERLVKALCQELLKALTVGHRIGRGSRGGRAA